MTLCLKKILLLIIVVPASIHWLGITLLGLMVFTHGTFYSLFSFFVTVLLLVGIFSLGVVIYTVIHYPKISKFAVYSIGVG